LGGGGSEDIEGRNGEANIGTGRMQTYWRDPVE
jgi:hypothetical protein